MWNDLNDDTLDYLEELISSNSSIQYLDLSKCRINSRFLVNLTGLKYIDLSNAYGKISTRDFRRFAHHANTLEGMKLSRTSTEVKSNEFQLL
mgnify:CR=1 FL=1